MEVIGICRFSYPAIGGFQVEFPTVEERRAYLYAPERMETRFRTFETMTLPALRAQTDGDFKLLVIVGECLPNAYRERLMDLLSDLPQALVRSYPPRKHRPVMREAVNSVRSFGRQPSLQFRMDDDDAVAVSYVARLRDVAAQMRDLAARYPVIAIDFNRGFIVRPGANGLAVAPTDAPYTTAGLAVMVQPGEKRCVMNFTHNKIATIMPTLTLTDENMMLRGYNDWNDSRQKPHVKPVALKPLDWKGEELFRSVYNIDAEHVRRVFSAP